MTILSDFFDKILLFEQKTGKFRSFWGIILIEIVRVGPMCHCFLNENRLELKDKWAHFRN